jgi:MoaD family protein
MKIKLFSNLRDIVGKDEIVIEVESSLHLQELLSTIFSSYGEMAKRYIFKPSGQIADHLLISINGNAISNVQDVCLKNDDNITILPVLAGG